MRVAPLHAVIHLPVLAPDEAVVVMRVLERVSDAIWRAHRDAIAAQALLGSDEPAPTTHVPPAPELEEEPIF